MKKLLHEAWAALWTLAPVPANAPRASRARLLAGACLAVSVGTAIAHADESQTPLSAPFFLSASDVMREGFVRLVNRSPRGGTVRAVAVDDAGRRYGSVTIAVEAERSGHFNSGDLELGNALKGLTGNTGPGQGDWRLEMASELDIEVLTYVRTSDGFLTSVQDTVPRRGGLYRIGFFNPGSNLNQKSLLRLVNPGAETTTVGITGIDDRAVSSGTVRVVLPPGAAKVFSADELESGAAPGLEGSLGDGSGKWRLEIAADNDEHEIVVMSLLSSPTGHVSNLSAKPLGAQDAVQVVPLFLSGTNPHGRQGFVRVINHSGVAGEVSIVAFDDTGQRYDTVSLSIGAKEARHFNSNDLELGNALKGLTGSTGPGQGDWRLELESELDIDALTYVRTSDGFLTSMHETVPRVGRVHHVGFFNPGSNLNQKSRLRLVNPGTRVAKVAITGIDDSGAPSRTLLLELPPGAAKVFTAEELESGDSPGLEGSLGDGSGKWRLDIVSDNEEHEIVVMSLLSSPTNHLTNLSAAGAQRQARESPEAVFRTLVSPTVQSTCIGCHVEGGEAGHTRLVFAPDDDTAHLSGNVEAFRNFLDEVEGGTDLILAKIDGQSHGGGVQVPAGTRTHNDMHRFLTLLGRDAADADDLNFLLAEVDAIGAPGIPGPLCVYGPRAFAVVVGAVGNARAPVVAAGRLQAGRVVALGHDGYFRRSALKTADTARLMTNALRWASGERAAGSIRFGVFDAPGMWDWLNEGGYDPVDVALTGESLSGVDVVAFAPGNQDEAEIEAMSAFVRGGGGLVMAATGWVWALLNPSEDLVEDHAGNRLLAPAGIQWSGSYLLDDTSPEGYAVQNPVPALTHAGKALDAVVASGTAPGSLTRSEMVQAIDTLDRSVRCLPPDDRLVAPRVHALLHGVKPHDWPTAQRPVPETDVFPRLAATLFTAVHETLPPESVRAHPSSADFPGSVPLDAERTRRRILVDTTVPRWHSTGMYAAPGDLVTVIVPGGVADTGGFGVRVGVHTDGIWHRPEWTRMPEISRRFAIDDETTMVANAFGGLIYVDVPMGVDLGVVEIGIEGAVAAPRFVLNETDPADWRDTIRHTPAPWAEIEGQAMIVTTPSQEVRALDDPGAVAAAWDRIIELCEELAAWPEGRRTAPERFVVDRQISNGYMHAGYPLMAHLDQQANLVDAAHLRSEGNWGFFHEAGHNHQNYDWTFDGTVEVTVNLFTLYIYEFLVGTPVERHYRGSPDFRATQMARYDFANPDFEQWKRDPFLALVMYEQLQQAFGWGAYRRVFATYLDLPRAERPKSDSEKRDQWMVRFSREVGRNLGPFFEAWGVPTSQAARDSIADLPEWLPADFPPTR